MVRYRVNITLFFLSLTFRGGLVQTPVKNEYPRIIDLPSKNVLVYIEIGEYYGILVILICELRKY